MKNMSVTKSGLLMSLTDKLSEEWFWVAAYGIGTVGVVVLNCLMLCSICKNAFLRTNTHRALAIMAFRNATRAVFSLIIVYTTRWSHPMKGWKFSPINSTKMGMPLFCDVLCAIDSFLTSLPMFMLVALAVHMFTRYPSPHADTNLKVYGDQMASLNTGLLPKEPCWLSLILPGIPIIMSAIISAPIPLLHLTHTLQAIPQNYICKDTYTHLTFDISVFILTYCLPVLLIFFLVVGLIVRRCLQCSARHCCNSWCKEEVILVCLFLILSLTHATVYLPIFEQFARKIQIQDITEILRNWITPEISRAIEAGVGGIALPLLCYLMLPAYRQFCTEPDPHDLKLSAPDGHESVIMTGVQTSNNELLPISSPTTPGVHHRGFHVSPPNLEQHQFATILTSSSRKSLRSINEDDL